MHELNLAFAAAMIRGTYFSRLDAALVRWMFGRYDLGLKYARWVAVQDIHIEDVQVPVHPKISLRPQSEFLAGPEWFVGRVTSLPDYMDFDISSPRIRHVKTWHCRGYRVVAVMTNGFADIYWYNGSAQVVANQKLRGTSVAYISRPDHIVTHDGNVWREMKLALPQIGYIRKTGCAVM